MFSLYQFLSMNLSWKTAFFDELSLRELYEIARLRQEVFVVEQDCPYIDFDRMDYDCYHLWAAEEKGHVHCYTRLVPKGIAYPEDVSIGRVITSQAVRGSGLGRELMLKSMDACEKLWPGNSIRISAQTYLLKFYNSLGFSSTGKEYLEDGIPHTEMLLEK
jgi:ElaA protein